MNDVQIKAQTVRQSSGAVLWRVTLLDGEKILEQKNLSVDAFTALIMDAQYRDEAPQVVRVGETPEGYVDGFTTTQEGTLGAIFYLAPHKHQFVLSGRATADNKRKAYYLPMPGLIYLVVMNKGSIRSMFCFAAKEYSGDETVLYQYPFGNVSHTGSVCMGSIMVSDVKDFNGIRKAIEESLDGETNCDYLSSNKVRLATDLTQDAFCEQIKDSEEFPLNLLLAADGKLNTVGDLKQELALIAKSL